MKLRHSIQQKILMLFLTVVVIGTVLWTIGAYIFSDKFLIKRSQGDANAAYEIACQVFENTGIDEISLGYDNADYQEVRLLLRSVARGFGLDYLYIYQVDKDANTRTYLMAVSSDDDKDEIARYDFAAGTVRSGDENPINERELMALSGRVDSAAWRLHSSYGDEITWIYPLTTDNGNHYLLGMDFLVEDFNSAVLRDVIIILVPLILLLLLIIITQLLFVRRYITMPLREISERMNTFVEDQQEGLSPLTITSGDEIQEIADSFNKMGRDITSYLAHIQSLMGQKAKADALVKVSMHIQSGILPRTYALRGDRYEVAAFAEPAKSLGGDFYDCITRDDGSICAVIGDVSGKGITAALFMTMVKTMLREKLRTLSSPAEALNYINDEVCAVNEAGMFATVLVMSLDTNTGIVTLANAGHTPPVVFDTESDIEPHYITPEVGIAIGLFEDAGIVDETVSLNPNEGILLYTDGVVEAVDVDNNFFTGERLLGVVDEATKSMSVGGNVDGENVDHATVVVDAVVRAVKDFQEGCEPFDDLTILSLVYKDDPKAPIAYESSPVISNPTPRSNSSHGQMSHELAVDLSSLDEINTILRDLVPNESVFKKILLATEEVFVNIINYSGADHASLITKKDSISNRLTLTFIDDGREFNPLTDAPAPKEFDEFDTGGMGISLVKRLANSLNYEYIDGKNCFTLGF